MTVNCLTATEKLVIVDAYKSKSHNQKELASLYNTSARTINRILIEAGVATPVERIKGDAYQVMQLLKKHGVGIEELTRMLEPYTNALVKTKEADTPWYPDDSGEWVEVADSCLSAPQLPEYTRVAILLRTSRENRETLFNTGSVDWWNWRVVPKDRHRIVAYKVVK